MTSSATPFKRVGLTGGIGSGKSTVGAMLRDCGAALGFGGVGGGHGLPRRHQAGDDVRKVLAFLAFERGPEGGALGGTDQGFQDGGCCAHGDAFRERSGT